MKCSCQNGMVGTGHCPVHPNLNLLLASELYEQLPNITLPLVFMTYNGQYHTADSMRVVDGHILIELRSANKSLQEFMEKHNTGE